MSKPYWQIASLLMPLLVSCDSSSTTDGQPNRGGDVTTDKNATQQRGGSAGDWSQGSGQPGTAASPSHQQGGQSGSQMSKEQLEFGSTAGVTKSGQNPPNAPGRQKNIPGVAGDPAISSHAPPR